MKQYAVKNFENYKIIVDGRVLLFSKPSEKNNFELVSFQRDTLFFILPTFMYYLLNLLKISIKFFCMYEKIKKYIKKCIKILLKKIKCS